ncbi:MAG TPA: replication initiator [Acidimicrobiales bacterium]|nr:replication initiator [Acidimicrobiales bacterium]
MVEFQLRGSVHLHGLVRVDVRRDELGPGPAGIDTDMLEAALRLAVAKVSAPVAGRSGRRVEWGPQLDVVGLSEDAEGRDRAVSYLAKYACKGSDRSGALDRRLRAGVPAAMPLAAHLRRIVEAAWELGADVELGTLRLRLWAHTCGFRGHFLTKSRCYSTTFGFLRQQRADWETARHRPQENACEKPEDEVTGQWRFAGSGYLNPGEDVLAANLADEQRLGRRLAYEARWRKRARR